MGAFLDWITGTDTEIERGKQLDAQIAAQNRKLVDRGIWDDATYAQYEKNAAANDSSTYSGQVEEAYDQGWEEGKKNTTGFLSDLFKRLITDPASIVLASIPWWVWLGLGIFLAWQLGLFAVLKRKFAK